MNASLFFLSFLLIYNININRKFIFSLQSTSRIAAFGGCSFTALNTTGTGDVICWQSGDDLFRVAELISVELTIPKLIFINEASIRSQGSLVKFSSYGGGTYAKQSAIAGIGVFSRSGHQQFDLIEVCPAFKIPSSTSMAIEEANFLKSTSFWKYYSLQNYEGGYYLPAGHCAFYNHGPEPGTTSSSSQTLTRNVYWGSFHFKEIDQVVTYMFAYKDIAPGEELLLDYGPLYFDEHGNWKGNSDGH